MENLENLNNFLEEIEILKKRSELLDKILHYYDTKNMNFDIPKKWKNNKILKSKLPAESPRHFIDKEIRSTLSNEELSFLLMF